ncbi:MAG: hypothetical protein WA154_12935 [Moraxellaceae bacterium]
MADFILSPSSLTTIDQAANIIVTTLGEAPVTNVEQGASSDVDIALICLDMADLQVQVRGWSWNTEDNWSLALDTDAKVPLPEQTLRVAAAYWNSGGLPARVVQRGSFLYDLDQHSLLFDRAPVVDLVVRLSWDELPQAARMYATLVATQSFHARMQERPILLNVNAQDLKMALVNLEQHEDVVGNYNSIHGNPSVSSALQGDRGMRRNRNGR